MKTEIELKTKNYKKVKGLSFIAARELLDKSGLSARIVKKDGKKCGLVKDHIPTRLNVELNKGKVSKLISFG